jgi:hypothetical protein
MRKPWYQLLAIDADIASVFSKWIAHRSNI